MTTLYFDHNATTPVDPVVVEAMLPFLTQQFANPSASYSAGRLARQAINRAREQVATAIEADPSEIIFTTSGSEANNLVIQGIARGSLAKSGHVGHLACTNIEHPCVLEPMRALASEGWALHELPVDQTGQLSIAALASLPEDTRLLSVMTANNETGVLQPIAKIAQAFRSTHGQWVHTDAVQAFGKHPLSFRKLQKEGVAALTLSAHKIGGPKGAAALVHDRVMSLVPLIYGGGQEGGLRSGTENVAAIVGFGVACERAVTDLEARMSKAQRCRDYLEQGLRQRGATIFAETVARLPNTTYAAFPGIDGETLVALLDRHDVAIASGAACGSGKAGISSVLQAMGVDPLLARGAIRISLGAMPYASTDLHSVNRLMTALDMVLSQLQRFSAVA